MIGPEQYKQLPHDPAYWVSASGQVIKRVNITHPERHQWIQIKQEDVKGTMRVRVSKKHTVARLVYSLFVGELKTGMVICHLNGNYRDNRWQNLYQGTQKENIGHKRLHGTWQSCEKHPKAKLNNEQALLVRRAIDVWRNPKTGRLIKGAGKLIAEDLGVNYQSVLNISRARTAYAELFQ